MKPRIHIIVPFVSINDYVIECVRYCLQLNYPNFLLILLPDSEMSLPPEMRDPRVRILVTGQETISAKRNQGIRAFTDCDYFAFIDSDAYPDKNWLHNAVAVFSMQEGRFLREGLQIPTNKLWVIGGPNITPPDEPLSKRTVGNASKSVLISGTYNFRKRIASSRFCNNLPTCNLIVSKKALDSIGPFNERLLTGEDIDLCTRIVKAGHKILYLRNVIVFHHNRSLYKPFLRQRVLWGSSVFRVLREEPSLSNFFLLLPGSFILFIIFAVFFSFFSELVLLLLLSVVSLYCLVVTIETFRWIPRFHEFQETFLALLLGNLAPGIGSLLAFVKPSFGKPSLKKFQKEYKNF
jgi:cellulose synthase/poly-beta-1,6-N-acetylglucosamine synthase-like glycosyltransferase